MFQGSVIFLIEDSVMEFGYFIFLNGLPKNAVSYDFSSGVRLVLFLNLALGV